MKSLSLLKSKTLYVALTMLLLLFLWDVFFGNVFTEGFSEDKALSVAALNSAVFQFVSMIKIVPPIFMMIGLLDVWVPRETMMKLMGEGSGLLGIGIAFFMGTLTAGPLVAAFPVASIMLKKGARYANVLFFIMVWASAKLPIIFFQITTLGLKYTWITNATLLVTYFFGAVAIEKLLTAEETRSIYELASSK